MVPKKFNLFYNYHKIHTQTIQHFWQFNHVKNA